MSRFDVVALGELLIDFACLSQDETGYPIMAAHPGGAPANFLAALNTYGYKTAFIGKVGTDTFGNLLVQTLQESGISTEGIVKADDVFTTLAFVTFNESGDREFSFARKPGADTRLCFDEIDLSIIDDTRIFHFGTLSLTDNPAREATQKAVEYAKSKGKFITFDPNLRKPLWKNLTEARNQMLWGMSKADIVKISDDEVEFFFGLSPEQGAKHILEEFGVSLVFVTCGADGCVYANRDNLGFAPSLRGLNVVDTCGAGDIFGGSAISQFLELGKTPDQIDIDDLKQIVGFATTAAGLSTTKYGGISSIHSKSEVLKALVNL